MPISRTSKDNPLEIADPACEPKPPQADFTRLEQWGILTRTKEARQPAAMEIAQVIEILETTSEKYKDVHGVDDANRIDTEATVSLCPGAWLYGNLINV